MDDECVIFLEEFHIGREGAFEEFAQGFIENVRRDEAMPAEDSPRVGVYDENRLGARIEENIVGRFVADSMDGKELGA